MGVFYKFVIFLQLLSLSLGEEVAPDVVDKKASSKSLSFVYEALTPQKIVTGCTGTYSETSTQGFATITFYIIDGQKKKKTIEPGSIVDVVFPYATNPDYPNVPKTKFVRFDEICFPSQCNAPVCGYTVGPLPSDTLGGTQSVSSSSSSVSTSSQPGYTGTSITVSGHVDGGVTPPVHGGTVGCVGGHGHISGGASSVHSGHSGGAASVVHVSGGAGCASHGSGGPGSHGHSTSGGVGGGWGNEGHGPNGAGGVDEGGWGNSGQGSSGHTSGGSSGGNVGGGWGGSGVPGGVGEGGWGNSGHGSSGHTSGGYPPESGHPSDGEAGGGWTNPGHGTGTGSAGTGEGGWGNAGHGSSGHTSGGSGSDDHISGGTDGGWENAGQGGGCEPTCNCCAFCKPPKPSHPSSPASVPSLTSDWNNANDWDSSNYWPFINKRPSKLNRVAGTRQDPRYYASLPGAIRGSVNVIYYPSCEKNAYTQPAILNYCPGFETGRDLKVTESIITAHP